MAVLLLEVGGWYFLSIIRSDKQSDYNKNTVLIDAGIDNNSEVAKSLIPKGANVNAKEVAGGVLGGAVTKNATVKTNNAVVPVATISANPVSVAPGGSTIISWSCSNSTFGSVFDSTANMALGTKYRASWMIRTAPLYGSHTYIPTCTGSDGIATKSVKVGVMSLPATYADDTTAPTTVGTITGGILGSDGWYTSNVVYTLTIPSADQSGVPSMTYCIDLTNTCTPTIEYTYGVPFIISTNSSHNYIRFRSIDGAGNVEAIKTSGAIKIDTTAR